MKVYSIDVFSAFAVPQISSIASFTFNYCRNDQNSSEIIVRQQLIGRIPSIVAAQRSTLPPLSPLKELRTVPSYVARSLVVKSFVFEVSHGGSDHITPKSFCLLYRRYKIDVRGPKF